MATDGVETFWVVVEVFTEAEIDFCVQYKELKEQIMTRRSEMIELIGKFIKFLKLENPPKMRFQRYVW